MRQRADAQDGSTLVAAALIMPLLALTLAAVLHLGLYLLTRQVAITAVQQGLTAATALDGTTGAGDTIARTLIDNHTAAALTALSTNTTATNTTMTATVVSPALVPGLPRTITITQTATRERWITE